MICSLLDANQPWRVTTMAYLIDGQKRRSGKTINGALMESFVYEDDLKRVGWYDGVGGVKAQFVYGTKRKVPEYMIQAGTVYRLVTDQVGSVRLVVNTSTGFVVSRIDYDEFGGVLVDLVPGLQPFGFAGGLRDLDTALTRFVERDYDAVTGRWVQKDPLRFGGGSGNLYTYVNGDVVNATDPTGLASYLCLKPLDALADYGGMNPSQRRSFNENARNPLFHEFVCTDNPNPSLPPDCGGLQSSNRKALGWGVPSEDLFSRDRCVQMVSPDQNCFDRCVREAIEGDRPWIYFVGGYFSGPIQNCQAWATDALLRCYKRCGR